MSENVPTEAVPTEETIKEKTKFELAFIYPDFAKDGYITPSAWDDLERYQAEKGEDNVLLSMYLETDGSIALGLFYR